MAPKPTLETSGARTPIRGAGDAGAALAGAKARLDGLDLYPAPVRIDRVRIAHAPWAFRLPGMRGFVGFASWGLILLRDAGASEDLLTHELCHVWQMQHHPLSMPLSYVLTGYADNPYELEARRAAARTAAAGPGSCPGQASTGRRGYFG